MKLRGELVVMDIQALGKIKMRIKLFIGMLPLLAPLFVLAQNDVKSVAPAKPMTEMDSVMVKELFFSAMRAKLIDDLPQASELFTRVLQTDPNNDAALYQLASLKIVRNNYTDAQVLLEKAVTVSTDNEYYWLALADCYEKNNDAAKLDTAFTHLLKINPDKPDYYFDEANVYVLEKKYDEALALYDQLEQLTGMDDDILAGRQKIYLIQGKIDKAASDIEGMIADNPSETRYSLLLAELYNSNGLNDKALKILQAAEKTDPSNGQVHLALADIYRDKKDNEACFNEIKLAFAIPDVDIDQKIKIISGYFPQFPNPDAEASALVLANILVTTHPDDAKAYAVYGDVLIQNDKVKEAETAYRKSLALNDQRYEVYEQLVRIEISNDETEQAIKDSEYALSLFPNQAWLNYLAGLAYLQKKEYTKSLSYLKNTTSLETDDKDLLSLCYSSLGDCYHELNDYTNSDSSYSKALTYNPDNAFVLNNYAYYLSLRSAQLDKAAQMSAHSNELEPNTASFEDTYAWILFKQKKYTDAKVWIEKAILHDKTNSAVQQEHYGDIMFYLGDTDAAVQNWKKAKSFGEQSPLLDRKINERKYIE